MTKHSGVGLSPFLSDSEGSVFTKDVKGFIYDITQVYAQTVKVNREPFSVLF